MGEEVQKPAEEKKPEEAKKQEEKQKPEEPPAPAEKPSDGGDDKKEEPKAAAAEESKDPPPPPPPQEIVLRVFMHCEGCARKVRRCLKGFEGVEDVQTDCKTHKVVVKGEKADPLKVLERVQKKSHRQVELLSPIPKPPAEEPKKEEVKEETKPEEKEPQVITVVLKVHMHCEACAQEIRKRILRMKGVESADPDLKSSQVTVKGAFEAANLVEYVYKRTGKHAVIVKQDPPPPPPPEKKEEGGEKGGKDGKEEKKGEEGGGEKKEEGGEAKPSEGGEDGAAKPAAAEQEDVKVVELRKNEFYYYYPQNYQVHHPARFAAESSYAYPPAPQMFSDENPNACSVM